MMNIGFIGTGHMGASLALAIKDNSSFFLYLNNRNIAKAITLSEKINNSKTVSIEEIVKDCPYIFIGVKPIDIKDVLIRINELKYQGIIISMAAGIEMKEMRKYISNPIIRIMPNTPVLVKSGLTLVNYSSNVNEKMKEDFLLMMKETGDIKEVKEEEINPISVITGSAPAYIDYVIDALIKAAVKEGLDEKEATYYVLKMMEGTIKLDLASNKSPLELGKEVCSPGGSTIEGVNVLIKNNIYDIINRAYLATLNKNKKMI
ncbi:MAG: pyrroline-5-carboxylate reductase [Bacilli bacterium]|nr:pyrroline-5-carboxylate reductase [Bacilli bacterium]